MFFKFFFEKGHVWREEQEGGIEMILQLTQEPGIETTTKVMIYNFQLELKFSLGAVIKASVIYIFYNSSIFENWSSSWIHVKNNMDFASGIL